MRTSINKGVKLTLALASMLFAVHCSTSKKNEIVGQSEWSEKMQELSQVISELFPFILSKEEFQNEKNFSEIEKNVKKLSELAHNVNAKSIKESPDADPAVQFLAKGFDAEIAKAYDALHTGHREYSRQVLAVATNHCINCHSRSGAGPQSKTLNLNFDYVKLNPFVRAEIYAATRQFTKAIDEYRALLKEKEFVVQYPFEVERALKKALAIYIRVLNDPDNAKKFIADFLALPDLPHFLKRQAKVWAKDLDNLSRDGSRKLVMRGAYKKTMDRLIADAQRRESNIEFDSPLVNYLRATALGHEYFTRIKKDQVFPEMLFNMGMCYESLQDLGYWTLHEDYYTRCIQERPHSEIADRCYNRLEQSIYLGYTGSAGTRIPPDVRAQLVKLKDMARQ
ncbi:MAG: hypothetical protein SGJ18_03645 [Pseudomonadota bacterium]|nr:hypothetical protein [Pseudomonadota bacterium]